MKKSLALSLCGAALLAMPLANAAEPLALASKDIKAGQTLSADQVFNGFGCEGKNLSPQLSWKNIPAKTKSLAITAYDPDAPTGSGWWHWVVFNISVGTTELPTAASGSNMPSGAIESMTDYGKPGFGGACPPKGDKPHHYIFTLWALDTESLPLGPNTPAAQVGYYLNQHKIETATLQATYAR
ncbi:YbhB/YbcL family Raf kinase inhibitor-like protein [bacterium]|nr:YbhB/YbcL family Raf kinase inhibitor-like protein [bacterium]